MMIGHAMLAFALGAWAAASLGVSNERALLIGAAAGVFATVPDVDMGYAAVGVVRLLTTPSAEFPEAVWDAGNTVHRGLTHSLVVGAIAATLFGLVANTGRIRYLSLGGLGVAVLGTFVAVGPLRAAVLGAFTLTGVLIAILFERIGLSARTVFGAALLGLLTHPFGDLFTGTTPTLFYPFDIRVLPELVELSGDPTIHLLGSFGLELGTVWFAVAVYLRLRGFGIWTYISPRAALGVGYAAMVFVLPPPTLAVSYQFVFSVLAVGLVGVIDLPWPDLYSLESRLRTGLTGLASVTIAWIAYGLGYLVLG
jgi:membrane-bound metal-dependent hydrolase YbcI (DUF457 family)